MKIKIYLTALCIVCVGQGCNTNNFSESRMEANTTESDMQEMRTQKSSANGTNIYFNASPSFQQADGATKERCCRLKCSCGCCCCGLVVGFVILGFIVYGVGAYVFHAFPQMNF
jgi:hypothetical protein